MKKVTGLPTRTRPPGFIFSLLKMGNAFVFNYLLTYRARRLAFRTRNFVIKRVYQTRDI